MDYLTYRWVKHVITILYTTYICVDLAHGEILRAKVGKGGINLNKKRQSNLELTPLWRYVLHGKLIFF